MFCSSDQLCSVKQGDLEFLAFLLRFHMCRTVTLHVRKISPFKPQNSFAGYIAQAIPGHLIPTTYSPIYLLPRLNTNDVMMV